MSRLLFSGKSTVESCRFIDILEWNRRGYLQAPKRFPWVWTRDGQKTASIKVEVEHDSVTLWYSITADGSQHPYRQRIPLAWTRCRFGGHRPWFICPVVSKGVHCGRRVTKLYGAGRVFACRHCYRLCYESQQESRNERGLWKAQKIRMQLGGTANMLEPFPEKPKGMHWRTYHRWFRTHDAAKRSFVAGRMRSRYRRR